MDHFIGELSYKGTILQINYRKMTIFSYNCFEKIHGKKFLAASMLYLNLCYNEVCYKGIALKKNNRPLVKSVTGK